MRSIYGQARLTKNIDFDRHKKLSLHSAKSGIESSLREACQRLSLKDYKITIPKETETTLRVALTAKKDDIPLSFKIEVSGRNLMRNDSMICSKIIRPPQDYYQADFGVTVYTADALVVSKILALMSDLRNVPRDIYDLYQLKNLNTNPVEILLQLKDEDQLKTIINKVWQKVELINYKLFSEELLPYLSENEYLNKKQWDNLVTEVASSIEQWCLDAIKQKKKK